MNKNKAEELDLQQEAPQEQMSLDDSRRVKVLSPGMLVFKRFIRNKLAVIGIFILVLMFLFAFLGPAFSPYARDQVFTYETMESGKYASGKVNVDMRFYGDIPQDIRSDVVRAIGVTKVMGSYLVKQDQEFSFDSSDGRYTARIINPSPSEPSCAVYGMELIASVHRGKLNYYNPEIVDSGLLDLIRNHVESESEEMELTYKDLVVTATITRTDTWYYIPSDVPVAIGTFNVYTSMNGRASELQGDVQFMQDLSVAVMDGMTEVEDSTGRLYTITTDANGVRKVLNDRGDEIFDINRDYHYCLVQDPDAESSEGEENLISFRSTLKDENEFISAMDEALRDDEHSFSYDDKTYVLEKFETELRVLLDNVLVVEVANCFAPAATKYDDYKDDLYFLYDLEKAIASGSPLFVYNEERYTISREDSDYIISSPEGHEMLLASDIAYGPDEEGTVLTMDFVRKLMDAIRTQAEEYNFVNQYGDEVKAKVSVNNGNYYITTLQSKELINSREAISSDHVLGTDLYGMDVLTRLMYGGRVSLLMGFVVVFFEIVLGVLVGGFSGYFGGVTDTILMRVVELFNCIPFYPMLLILGSVLDAQRSSSETRLILTMVILGILSWTGVARIVRGQILSLREQDFMIATESTGIRTSRRIFKHLVPNVMPLLIVEATQSLGGIILTEATLGYLGLGVKYPMVSWGAIVNQANDMHVMNTAWWIWIPAGFLILTTVLGFNFVGDGLRDAFDPKMKR